MTCSRVSNIDSAGIKPLHVVIDTTKSMDNLYGRKDFYYGTADRIFMVFQDRSHINGDLSDFPKIYNNPKLKVSKYALQSIDKQIERSHLVDKGEKNYDSSGQLNGIVTEFVTEDNVKYVFAGLSGGEVANDHYPKYEFLFAEKNNQYELINKQRFYIDIAGIEGLEYANIAPFFSILLTVIGLVSGIIIVTINRKIRIRNKKSILEVPI